MKKRAAYSTIKNSSRDSQVQKAQTIVKRNVSINGLGRRLSLNSMNKKA